MCTRLWAFCRATRASEFLDSLGNRCVSSGSMNLPRRLLPLILVLMVSTLLGHICTLPAGAGSAAVASHGATSSAESHDSDGAHTDIASCDATLSKPAPVLSPLLDSAPVISSPSITTAPPMLAWGAKPRHMIAPRRAPDRSLCLLNASFLI